MIEIIITRKGYITEFDLISHMVAYERFPELTSQYISWDEKFGQYKILQPLPDLTDWWEIVLSHCAFPLNQLKEKLREEIGTVVVGTLYPVAIDNPRFQHVQAIERINKSIDLTIEELDIITSPEMSVSFFPEERCRYMSTSYRVMINSVRTILTYVPTESPIHKGLLDIKALFRAAYRYTIRLPRRLNWTRGVRFPRL